MVAAKTRSLPANEHLRQNFHFQSHADPFIFFARAGVSPK